MPAGPDGFMYCHIGRGRLMRYNLSIGNGSLRKRVSAMVAMLLAILAAISMPARCLPSPAAPQGMPASADFLPKATDPRAAQPYGSAAGYSAMKRLANGHMIVFGMSHTANENNAVETYDPVANKWTVRIPHTAATWARVGMKNRNFLGNRDNQVNMMLRPFNEYWVMEGEGGGMNADGNYRGIVDTLTWKWKFIDDNRVWEPSGDDPPKIWDGVGEWIDELNCGVIYGGTRGNPGDWLQIFMPKAGIPRFARKIYSNEWGNQSFPGAEMLRYVSQSNWVRGKYLYIYAGIHRDRALVDSKSQTIYKLDVTNPDAPVMTTESVNTLPADQAVKGDAVLGDYDRVHDLAMMTDGVHVNVYSYATKTWANVPVNTPADPARLSPDTSGTGAQGRWSPEVGQMIILSAYNGRTFGLRLNYSTGSASLSPTSTPSPSSTSSSPPLPPAPLSPPAGRPSSSGTTIPPAFSIATTSGEVWTLGSDDPGTPGARLILRNGINAGGGSGTTLEVANNVIYTGYGGRWWSWTERTWVASSDPNARTPSPSLPPPALPPPSVSPPSLPPSPSAPQLPSTRRFPPAGNLTLTATAVPYVGVARVLANSKHLDFARLGNRWYKMAGDHSATGSPLDVAIPPNTFQGGRQEILSFNVPANDWREDTPYYLPASYGVQGANPDDSAFVVTVGSEIWVANSETNRGIDQPAGAAKQVDLKQQIGAYTPPSTPWRLGHWRVVAPVPWILHGNRAWRGFFDPVKNRIIVPAGNGTVYWVTIDATTGADLTQYINGQPVTHGNHWFTTAGVATDFANRKFYLYDIIDSELWQADMDTLALAKIANIPEPPAQTQSAVKITWHPDLRAVVMNLQAKTHAFEVDSGKLTSWPRRDGYVDARGIYIPTSTLFFDSDTHDIVSVGTEDFNEGGGPAPLTYWRLKIH
jgi:hypothetical protein